MFIGHFAVGLVTYVANILGPPPPNPRAIAFVTLTLWLVPVWAWWIDRHRTVKPAAAA